MGSSSSSIQRSGTQKDSPHSQSVPRTAPPGARGWNEPLVDLAGWSGMHFQLGAGLIIFQPSTASVVLVYDRKDKVYFLPRGRKDIGETLEAAALREGFEESGYRAQFYPLYKETRQPPPPDNRAARVQPNTEPIAVTMVKFPAAGPHSPGGDYFVHWYVGLIPEDVVRQEGSTLQFDELDYDGQLISLDDERVHSLCDPSQQRVLDYAIGCFRQHLRVSEMVCKREEKEAALAASAQNSEPAVSVLT